MVKGIINRLEDNEKQTLGHLTIYKDSIKLFDCYTLELPDKNNEQRISRIPPGSYQVQKRHSKKFGNHFHILDVPGRSWILIHSGNFYTQIKGCVLVGNALTDINQDGERDVVNSRVTLKQLLKTVDKFQLLIF